MASAPYFSHIYLVVGDSETKEKLTHLLAEHLIFQEKPHKTFTDKMAEWLTQLMPEDEVTEPKQTPIEPSIASAQSL